MVTSSRDHTARIWGTSTGKELRRVKAYQKLKPGDVLGGHAAALSPDGKTLAVATPDGVIRLVEEATGKEMSTIAGHVDGVRSMCFSPDGKRLVSGGGDNDARVWDIASGKEVSQRAHNSSVEFVTYSPNGQNIASSTNQTAAYVWEAGTGKDRFELQHNEGMVFSIAFSSDGKLVASTNTNGSAYVWNANDGTLVRKLDGHPSWIASVAFSVDCRTLAVGSWRSVRLWEMATGNERRRMMGNDGDVTALAFAPDGRTLAVGGLDTTALVWNLTRRLHQGQLKTAELSASQVESLWNGVEGDDAGLAYQALWELVASPTQAIGHMKKTLLGVAKPDLRAKISKYLADLDKDEFEVRNTAVQELEKLGKAAESALRKALENKPSAEARAQINGLLKRLSKGIGAADRRAVRAAELLEYIAAPGDGATGLAAINFLKKLAAGAPEARLTQEAKAALERSGKRLNCPRRRRRGNKLF